MKLFKENPYRILGLSVISTDREIAKRMGDISIYAEMGKAIDFESDNYFNFPLVRTPESLQEAKQKIEQPSNKIFYSHFWFWENENNTFDDMAFEELKNGNIDKAVEFWERGVGDSISSKNKSNYKNLSTLLLGLSIKDGRIDQNYFYKSLNLSGKFLSSNYFNEYIFEILGKKNSINSNESINEFVDSIITEIKPFISNKQNISSTGRAISNLKPIEFINNFSTFPESIQNEILEKFTINHIHNIEKMIDNSKSVKEIDAKKAGFDLHKYSQDDLNQLKLFFTKTDLKYQLVADKLAEEIFQCAIAYFNKYYDSSIEPGEDALQLVKFAQEIAVGDNIKNKIVDNLSSIEEYIADKPKRRKLYPVKTQIDNIYRKIREVQAETNVPEFPNIAKEFINNCKPSLERIKSALGINDDDFLEISDLVAGNAMGKCNEMLNLSLKFAEEKYPYDNYGKRKFLSSIIILVEPVYDLVGKLEMSHSKRKEYTENCRSAGFTARRPYRARASSSSSSGSTGYTINSNSTTEASYDSRGCYIATMVYDSYDAPEVKVLRNFRNDVLLKSFFGNLFVKIYYKFSPKIVEITKNKKYLNTLFKIILNQIVRKLMKNSRWI